MKMNRIRNNILFLFFYYSRNYFYYSTAIHPNINNLCANIIKNDALLTFFCYLQIYDLPAHIIPGITSTIHFQQFMLAIFLDSYPVMHLSNK